MPSGLQHYLQFSRYILAIIIVANVAATLVDFSNINAYKTFTHWMSGKFVQSMAIAIMGSFLIVALFFERPFCNYFCSEGIRYGLASFTRLFTIKRDVHTCV